jgi:hypothetical protein
MCGVVLLTFSALVAGEEYVCSITKVDGDKVTVQKFKKGEKGKKGEADGDPIMLTASKECKVLKGKFDKETKKLVAGDAIEGGLKNEMFSKAVFARVTVEGSTLSEVLVMGGTKKKKDSN